MIDLPFSRVDYLALAWFVVGWFGYQLFANWAARKGWPCLMTVMGQYRRDWWHGLIMRELRIVDANILTNLSNSATFFASTTLLILGALLALLGTSDDAMSIISDMLGCRHPVIQGAMGAISNPERVAAVSEAGGMQGFNGASTLVDMGRFKVRALNTPLVEEMLQGENSLDTSVGAGLAAAWVKGDLTAGTLPAGQVSGLISRI